jgi:hypothetical protein
MGRSGSEDIDHVSDGKDEEGIDSRRIKLRSKFRGDMCNSTRLNYDYQGSNQNEQATTLSTVTIPCAQCMDNWRGNSINQTVRHTKIDYSGQIWSFIGLSQTEGRKQVRCMKTHWYSKWLPLLYLGYHFARQEDPDQGQLGQKDQDLRTARNKVSSHKKSNI